MQSQPSTAPNVDVPVEARYFKKEWESPQENLKIKAIKFGVFSEREIHQLSTTEITCSSLYNPDTLKPNENGPLDPRLGLSGGKDVCATCNLRVDSCVGHFGHIDLVLPCFHIGYVKQVIQILRMICKSCARLLLPVHIHAQGADLWRKRMRYEGLCSTHPPVQAPQCLSVTPR